MIAVAQADGIQRIDRDGVDRGNKTALDSSLVGIVTAVVIREGSAVAVIHII